MKNRLFSISPSFLYESIKLLLQLVLLNCTVCARDFVQPITTKALFQTGLNISDSTEPVSLLDRKPHTVFFFFLKRPKFDVNVPVAALKNDAVKK